MDKEYLGFKELGLQEKRLMTSSTLNLRIRSDACRTNI